MLLAQRGFNARTQARQRRAQIVGHIAGDFAHPLDELFNLPQHLIERCCQTIKLIPGTRDRHAAAEIAIHNHTAGFSDGINAAQKIATHKKATAKTHCQR